MKANPIYKDVPVSKTKKLVRQGYTIKDAILKVCKDNGYVLDKNGYFKKA